MAANKRVTMKPRVRKTAVKKPAVSADLKQKLKEANKDVNE